MAIGALGPASCNGKAISWARAPWRDTAGVAARASELLRSGLQYDDPATTSSAAAISRHAWRCMAGTYHSPRIQTSASPDEWAGLRVSGDACPSSSIGRLFDDLLRA
jgi:hypothetical protein